MTINTLITHLQDLEAVLSVSNYSYSSSFALFISHSSKASGSPEALLFFLRLCFDLGPSGPHVTSLAGLFATLALGAWRGQRNHSRPGSCVSALVTCRPVSPLDREPEGREGHGVRGIARRQVQPERGSVTPDCSEQKVCWL